MTISQDTETVLKKAPAFLLLNVSVCLSLGVVSRWKWMDACVIDGLV